MANATISTSTAGGLLSLGALVASAVFFGFWVFGVSVGDILLEAAGLFSLSLAFVLARFGL
jgi:hypothetical protein